MLFDSIEGHPPPGEKDGNLKNKIIFQAEQRQCQTGTRGFEKIGYPSGKSKIVPGWLMKR